MQAYHRRQEPVSGSDELCLKSIRQSIDRDCLPSKDFKPFHPIERVVVHAPAAYDDKVEDRMELLPPDLDDDMLFAFAESLTPLAVPVPHEEGSIGTEYLIGQWFDDLDDDIHQPDSRMDLHKDKEAVPNIDPIPLEDIRKPNMPLEAPEDIFPDDMDIDDIVVDCQADSNGNRDNDEVPNDEVPMQLSAYKPGPEDVLTGQSRDLQNHPGNVKLRKLAEAHYNEYERVKGNPVETTLFYQKIQDKLRVRFLHKQDGSWIEMLDSNDIHQIVASKFRSITKSIERRNRKKVTEASNNLGKKRKTNTTKQNKKKKQRR